MSLLKKIDSYVAYIDILGFAQLMNDPQFTDKIERIVEVLRKRRKNDSARYPYLTYIVISDTIIIVSEGNTAQSLLWKISQVQNALLLEGFATRGGITYGPVLKYVEPGQINVFGETYLAAYELEQKRAIYPRVVMDSACAKRVANELESKKYDSKLYLRKDSDGVSFVNQFLRDLKNIQSADAEKKEKSIGLVKKYQNVIQQNIKTDDPQAKMKWYWLR